MELIKKNIRMNRLKSRTVTQITLDDDFIVPDVRADIDGVITSEGNVIIDTLRITDGRVNITGRLQFRLLYICNSGGKRLHNMEGSISFDENLLLEGLREGDNVNVKWDIEDLNIGIINTRKISARAVVSLEAVAEDVYEVSPAVALGDVDASMADCLMKKVDISQIAVSKRDILRVREELNIPSNKGNIYNILWNTVRLKNTSARVLDGKISISGEISAMVLYEVEEEHAPVQWVDTVVPFSGVVEAACAEGMIPDIEMSISSVNVQPRPDQDGEQRILELDAVIELGIKVYSEECIEYISDIYSTGCELNPTVEKITYNTILMRNQSKAKVSDKLKLNQSGGNVMQLLGSEGIVKLDEIRVNDPEEKPDTITAQGYVCINLMYISSDDMRPISVASEIIPFSHQIEAPGITSDAMVFIRPSLEQLTTVMVGNNEIEAKAVAVFDTLILGSMGEEVILDVEEAPLDMEKLKAIPSMTGYFVKKGDTLWKIAKRYYTTVDNIRKVNELKGDEIAEGDMLLVVKDI